MIHFRLLFLDDRTSGGAVPTRDQISPEDTWDLSLLFPSDEAWEKAYKSLEQDFPSLTQHKGKLGTSAEALAAALEAEKQIDLRLEKLYHFASLRHSEDSSNSANLGRRDRVINLWSRIAETCAFISPEIMAIPDEDFERYLQDPRLNEWKRKLSDLRRFKPHTLSEKEERLLALASPALAGHNGTFSQLTNVDMRFGTLRDEEGREIELSQGSFSSFLVKPDRTLRRKAFEQFYAEFDDHKYTLASALASSVKADVFQARARNYPSAREAALFPDQVPTAVYDNLIESVRNRLPDLYRYYDVRRRLLGLDAIHHYDTYVPVVTDIKTNIPWDEAVTMVTDALAPLGSEYTEVLRKGLNGRWCDRYETKGKRSGAFSSGSYGNVPYILMNYKPDVFTHVFTLAHEAGHSMHTWFSQQTQRYQDYDYPIFLAEVASTFNEELLVHHLLEKTSDARMKAYLINRQIDDIRATLFRQTMFAEFEKIIHEMEEAGEPLTLESFRKAYRALLDAYFGPDFVIDPQLELECLRIPHFYNAFYVYKYATGLSAAIALSQRVLHGGKAELDDYMGFLRSGRSLPPLETLQRAGVDMTSPDPVNAALDVFSTRVKELEDLLA
jgi:oligoendopeptidase F